MKSALILCLLALLVMSVDAKTKTQQRPQPTPAVLPFALPSVDESGVYTKDELRSLDLALESLGMTRTDLGFEKKHAEQTLLLPIVAHLLDFPLDNPIYASLFADKWPGGLQAEAAITLAFHQISMTGQSAPDPEATALAMPSDEAGWQRLLEGLSVTTAEAVSGAKAITALPAAIKPTLALFCQEIPSIAHEFEQAFAKLSAREFDTLCTLAVAMAVEEEVNGPLAAGKLKDFLKDEKAFPASELLQLVPKVDWLALEGASRRAARLYDKMIFDFAGNKISELEFKSENGSLPLNVATPLGRIVIGSSKNDVYEENMLLLIEPNGNDVYRGHIAAAAGCDRRFLAYHFDLAGDDAYLCGGSDFTLGAALAGGAFFYDAAGDDVYEAGSMSEGSAILGVAVLQDAAGNDIYRGRAFCQGAAAFGVGWLCEGQPDGLRKEGLGNDTYRAARNSQAFSTTLGIGILEDDYGNDVYEAGGVFMHRPLYEDRYQSMSQGFSIGIRPDAGGGLAFLIDRSGNDHYDGEVYGQGAGYWYSAGFLIDESGNDSYTLTIYGQGAGIHLACGTLLDKDGNDSYLMTDGLGQGGAHDFAVGVLMDNAGNDRYVAGNASNQGTGLTNAVGLFFDRSGNDLYAACAGLLNGAGRPERGYGSIGIFVDLGGVDRFTLNGEDNAMWSGTEYGAGVDNDEPATKEPEAKSPVAAEVSGQPEFRQPRAGERLSRDEFNKLWETASQWAVGLNAERVANACKTIAAYGPQSLSYVKSKLVANDSLETRAITEVCKQLLEHHRNEVAAMARHGLRSKNELIRKNSLGMIVDLSLTETGPDVAKLINKEEMMTQAIAVCGRLGYQPALPRLRQFLGSSDPKIAVAAAGALCRMKDVVALPRVLKLLGHESVVVRMAMIERIPDYGEQAAPSLCALAKDAAAPEAVRINALLTMSHMEPSVKKTLATDLIALLGDPNWAVRGHAVEQLQTLTGDDAVQSALAKLRETEIHPYVRYLLNPPKRDGEQKKQ